MKKYKYRLSSTEKSSVEYGVCEVCGQPCNETFYQVEEKRYKIHKSLIKERNAKYGYTQHECKNYFGHKECLEGKQR